MSALLMWQQGAALQPSVSQQCTFGPSSLSSSHFEESVQQKRHTLPFGVVNFLKIIQNEQYPWKEHNADLKDRCILEFLT